MQLLQILISEPFPKANSSDPVTIASSGFLILYFFLLSYEKIKLFRSLINSPFLFSQPTDQYPPNLRPFVVLTKTTVGNLLEHLL